MHTELIVAKAVTVLLGLAIALQAYRGGRRHASRPMYFLAGGFVLISVFIEVAAWSVLRAGLVQTALVGVGMVLILYALYGGDVQ